MASTPSRTIYYDGDYALFGESYAETVTTDRSFTRQNQDTVPGLSDFLYRENSPTQGRWISPDPASTAVFNLTNPQSLNRYAYVNNGSMNAVDPLGLVCTGDDFGPAQCNAGNSGALGHSGGDFFGGWSPWQIGSIPVTFYGWIPGSSTTPTPVLDANGNPLLDSQGNPRFSMSFVPGHWGDAQVGTGFDILGALGVDSTWLRDFVSTFTNGVIHGVRQRDQTFSQCVGNNLNELAIASTGHDLNLLRMAMGQTTGIITTV